MGSKRAYTQVSVVRMFEDLPDLKQQAVMGAILDGRSISNSLTMSNMQGPARAIEAMRKYAESGRYAYGTADIVASADVALYADTAWIQYLATIHTVGEVDSDTLDLITIDEYYSSEVGTQGNRDIKVQYALQVTPIADGSTFVSRVDNELDTIITANDGVADYIHLTIPIPVLDFAEHYAEYRVRRRITEYGYGGTEVTGYTFTTLGTYVRVYNEATGNIPALHSVDTFKISDSIYPVVPIRVDGVDYEDIDEADDIYKMLKKINIDPQSIVDGIKDNPDEDSIDDVFVGFGTSVTVEDEWGIAGLAHTFSILHSYNTLTKQVYDLDGTRQSISIKEAGFDNTISYNYITSETKVGNPGYTRRFTEGEELEICVPNPSYGEGWDFSIFVCEVAGSTNEYTFTIPNGNGTYEEIVVSGLTSRHTVLVPGFGERVHQFLGDGDELVVPLIKAAVNAVPRRLRDDLVYGSLHMFAYSYEIVKLKWYQRGIFKAFLTIAAIAFAVFTYGQSIVAAFAASTVAGALAIAKILAITMLVDYAVAWLMEEVGGALALILAVAASLVTTNFQTLTATFNTSWYSLFTAAVKVHGAYINNELEQIVDDQNALEEAYETRQEQIDAANDAMDWGVTIDLLELGQYRSQPNILKGETVQEFYDRTSTVVDLPTISNNLVTLYHEAQLELPTVDPFSINPTYKVGF